MLQILAKAAETFDDACFFVNSHLTQADPYLYIGKYEGEEWDFDNEIFGCSQTTEALLQGMDPDTHLTILRIKGERLHTRGGSWRGSSQPGRDGWRTWRLNHQGCVAAPHQLHQAQLDAVRTQTLPKNWSNTWDWSRIQLKL